jgi:hypothetical protein
MDKVNLIERVIDKFFEIFINRTDTYLEQKPDGRYVRVDKPLDREVLVKHLVGEVTVGVYALNKAGNSKWLCYDFDGADAEQQAKKLFEYLQDKPYGHSVVWEVTGGRGHHLWIFFEPTSARYLRYIGEQIARRAGIGEFELFPKQDALNGEVEFGNGVRLPLGIHKRTGRRSTLLHPKTVEEFLQLQPYRIPPQILKQIDEEIGRTEEQLVNKAPEDDGATVKTVAKPWWTRCEVYRRIKNGVEEGFRDESCFFLARIYRDAGLTPDEALKLLLEWNARNRPPLLEKIIREKIKQAYSKGYLVGFRTVVKNVLKSFCPIGCEECRYALGEEASGEIRFEYQGNGLWKVIGLSVHDLTLPISSGAQLLNSKRLDWLRKEILKRYGREKLYEYAVLIDETREGDKRQEEERERSVSTVATFWRNNEELMKTAGEYVERKLKEFMMLPYPENLYAYDEWLKNEVLTNILCGENINKVLGFIIILFGSGFILNLPGRSSIGKSMLVDSFIALREHYMTRRLTEHALEHFDPSKVEGKLLYLREAATFEGSIGVALKALEDYNNEEYIVLDVCYPVKDPRTDKIVTIHQAVRIRGFISTMNVMFVETPGLLERKYIIQMDDSPEQNVRVLNFIDQINFQENEKKLNRRKWTDREWCLALTDCLLQALKSVDIGEELLLPYENLASIVLKDLAADTEVRRHARKLPQFLRWFSRAYWFFLPVYEVNGKRFRVLAPEALKIALEYFYHLVEAKQQFRQPYLLKIAKKLVEAYKQEVRTEDPNIEVTKTSRELLAQKLGLSRDSIMKYLNNLAVEVPQAVEKLNVGREVVHRINIEELSVWIGDNLGNQPLALSSEQLDRLEESFKRCLEKWNIQPLPHTVDLFLPTSKTSENGLILPDKPENVGKPVFPLFSERSELENLENGENDVGRKEGGVEGGERIVLSQSKTLINGSAPLLQPAESRVCRDCMHWDALRCIKHPDWIVVTPTARYARTCGFFTLRNNGEEGR